MNPHKASLLVAAVAAGLGLASAFGAKITEAQDASVLGFVVAVLAVVGAFVDRNP
jgi:hypothetical protein